MAVIRSILVRSNRLISMCGALYLAIAILLSPSALLADPAFQFHTIDKQQGLVSSVVYDIAQDHDGFMWFATEDGLQRYDGYEFVSYRHSRLDENSISSNVVRSLLVDTLGRLWVGTNNGLNLYSKENDNFIWISNRITNQENDYWDQILALYESNDGTIWIGSKNGLSKYSHHQSQFTNYAQTKVRSILEDSHRRLWIGTLGAGLFLFDRNSGKFDLVKSTEVSKVDFSKLNVIDIYQESTGKILVATWGDGVFSISKGQRKLSKFEVPIPSEYVKNFIQDENGQIWIGTNQGILVVDRINGKSLHILADKNNNISPNSDNVFKIFQGIDDIVWIGTYGGGVSYHNPSSRRFESFGQHSDTTLGLSDPVIFSIAESRSGNIWLGSEKGLLTEFNTESRTFLPHDLLYENKVFHGQIAAILEIEKGLFLLGTSNGLYSYRVSSGLFNTVKNKAGNHINDGEGVRIIEKDYRNRIWVGFHESGFKIFEHIGSLKNENMSVQHIDIRSPQAWLDIGEDKYLVGTNNRGVYEVDLGLNSLIAKQMPDTRTLNVVDLAKDKNDKVWIASWSKGIRVISKNGEITNLDEDSGMPNNTIYSVQLDNITNNIWATTNRGMVAIDIDKYEIKKYDSYDGLQGDEFNRPGILSETGYLYFGGVNGFTRFYPSITNKNFTLQQPIMTGLSVANKKIEISPNGSTPLVAALREKREIILPYDQTPFSISFTSPQFVKPSEIEYRYRLLGLDERWVTSDSKIRKATYTNTDPGDYIFELQARISKEDWGNTIVRKNITILAPWWLTIVAKVIYMLIITIVLSIIFYLNWKRRQSDSEAIFIKNQSEERLRLSLWGGGNELWDWDIVKGDISRSDEATNISINCNSLSEGFSELNNYIHKYDVKRVKEQLRDHLRGRTEYFESVYRIKDSKLGWRWIQDRAKVVERDKNNRPTRMSGTQKDISEIQRKDEEIERLGQAFKTTSDGVWIRDAKWKLIEVNPSFKKITGFAFNEKKGEELWFPEHADQTANIIQRIRLSLMEKGHWQGEVWAERKNEDPFPQKLTIDTILDEKGHASYYVGVFSDNTFQKRAEDEFRKLANFDSLTGLPNRACLYDRLNQTIDKTRIRRERFALFVVDIDNFKRINDSMGHSVGDTLISEVAMRLTHCNRDGDTIARIGGDEFVIIRDDIQSSTEIASFAEKMLVELNEPIFVKGQKLSLNFSIGITISPDDGASAEKLLRNADTAMYEAKKDVQNSFHFYSIELNQKARKRLAMENELRRAVEFDLFDVEYQPKVDMETGTVLGMEALARWVHPKFGNIGPDEFIPLAENTGLIIELGNQILTKAVAETKRWVDLDLMKGKMSVNLSAHQFLQEDLPSQVLEILDNEGLGAEYLELELTESAFIQDMALTIKQMNQLRKLGINLALDDFGTGYSSLAQLKALPLDTLKIDKSFIQNIADSPKDLNVVKAIIDIGKSLGLSIVIEGVESKLQCDKLWQCRANIIQGFFFSKPVKRKAMTKLLEKKWERSAYLSKISDNVTSLG